jgi:hypothetical protein
MSWKTFVVVIVTLGCCPSLIAQDKQSEPFLGIWEINLTRTVNYPQQSQMIINVPTPGGGFISTRATIAKENKSSSAEVHPVAFHGKPHATTGGDGREIAYKPIDPYTIERTHNRTEESPSIQSRSRRTARRSPSRSRAASRESTIRNSASGRTRKRRITGAICVLDEVAKSPHSRRTANPPAAEVRARAQ